MAIERKNKSQYGVGQIPEQIHQAYGGHLLCQNEDNRHAEQQLKEWELTSLREDSKNIDRL